MLLIFTTYYNAYSPYIHIIIFLYSRIIRIYKRTEEMGKQPFIIIFDIDQTIIGNVHWLSSEKAFLELIYNTCKKKGINAKCPSIDVIDMQDELKNGLLRPNTADFIHFCNKRFKNAEVFFYTNSSHSWTNSVLGKSIEKALKIKINRPFFTRENSMSPSMKKSLANIYPTIIKSLLPKYPSLKDANTAESVFNNRMIFVDDIKDNVFAYTKRQLVCPAYDYWPYYDMYDKFITKYKMSPQIFNDKDILKYMSDHFIYIYNKNGDAFQKDKDYIAIANLYNKKHSELSRKDDTYYKELIKELSKGTVKADRLTDKNIAVLNKKLATPKPS